MPDTASNNFALTNLCKGFYFGGNMPFVHCKICNTQFYIKEYHLKKGWGKYCSKACQYRGQMKGQSVSCSVCDKQVWKSSSQLKHSKSKKYFCSKTCQTLWRNLFYSGAKSPSWKNGINAYRKILSRETDIKKICVLCKTEDQRVLAVHHIDQNRANNSIYNLAWLCHNCHHLVHHHPKEKDIFLSTIRSLKVFKFVGVS